jgi:hypothetical protein
MGEKNKAIQILSMITLAIFVGQHTDRICNVKLSFKLSWSFINFRFLLDGKREKEILLGSKMLKTIRDQR